MMVNKMCSELQRLGACQEAIDWVEDRDLETAWAECNSPFWMLWYADKIGIEKQYFVRIACLADRMTLAYVKEGNLIPLQTIEAAERWLDSPTVENQFAAAEAVIAAFQMAYVANAAVEAVIADSQMAYVANAAAAAAAASRMAYVAKAVDAVSAAAAAAAASRMAYAAHAGNAAAACEASLAKMAELVRSVITIQILKGE